MTKSAKRRMHDARRQQDALAWREAIEKVNSQDTRMRCNCENAACAHSAPLRVGISSEVVSSACTNVGDPEKRIDGIGPVCGDCYEKYPAIYRSPPRRGRCD